MKVGVSASLLVATTLLERHGDDAPLLHASALQVWDWVRSLGQAKPPSWGGTSTSRLRD